MALGKKCGPLKSRRGAKKGAEEVDLGLELGRGYYTRGFGRKRIAVLNNTDSTPSKKRFGRKRLEDCGEAENGNGSGTSPLESLPQDILIRIVCGVDHDDLEQLVHVSKTIREVTSVAKQCHFAYSTPKKNRTCFVENDFNNWDDIEAPAAPRRFRSRPSLAGISVALFASPGDVERWPRKELLMEM